jgi:DNA polymerase-4
MGIFHDLTGLVEPLSLDEAYLDITDLVLEGSPPLRLALDLKRRVKEETGLTLSVGAATSKSVAKIASDLNKPDGLVVVLPGEEAAFLAPLPVGRLLSIGPKTTQRLNQEGIATIGQLAQQPLAWFTQRFGQRAAAMRTKALGEDREPVHTERVTKSVSAETTFANDLGEPAQLNLKLAELADRVARHLEHKGLRGKTVTVKARLADFTTFTRQVTLPAATAAEPEIRDTAWRLLSLELQPGRTFRLLGVGVSSFEEAEGARQLQLPLFEGGTVVGVSAGS